jgi:hypothetical protein
VNSEVMACDNRCQAAMVVFTQSGRLNKGRFSIEAASLLSVRNPLLIFSG